MSDFEIGESSCPLDKAIQRMTYGMSTFGTLGDKTLAEGTAIAARVECGESCGSRGVCTPDAPWIRLYIELFNMFPEVGSNCPDIKDEKF